MQYSFAQRGHLPWGMEARPGLLPSKAPYSLAPLHPHPRTSWGAAAVCQQEQEQEQAQRPARGTAEVTAGAPRLFPPGDLGEGTLQKPEHFSPFLSQPLQRLASNYIYFVGLCSRLLSAPLTATMPPSALRSAVTLPRPPAAPHAIAARPSRQGGARGAAGCARKAPRPITASGKARGRGRHWGGASYSQSVRLSSRHTQELRTAQGGSHPLVGWVDPLCLRLLGRARGLADPRCTCERASD